MEVIASVAEYKPGDSIVLHAQIVGDTSLKLFTVHIVDKGKPLYDYGQ
jgi:hypothetical protein